MAWTLMFMMLFGLLGAFGYYTYNGTVVPNRADSMSHGVLQPRVHVEESMSGTSRSVIAYLSLQNASPDRMRLVDMRAIEPLYEIQLRVKPEGRDAMEFAQMNSSRAPAARPTFNADEDALVELLPGSALTRALNLSALYDMHQNGTYELTIKYQPDSVLTGSKDLLAATASTLPISCSVNFDLPMKKPEAKDAKKEAAPGKAPGLKPEAAPPEKPSPAPRGNGNL